MDRLRIGNVPLIDLVGDESSATRISTNQDGDQNPLLRSCSNSHLDGGNGANACALLEWRKRSLLSSHAISPSATQLFVSLLMIHSAAYLLQPSPHVMLAQRMSTARHGTARKNQR